MSTFLSLAEDSVTLKVPTSVAEQLDKRVGAWFSRIRKKSVAVLKQNSFPTEKDESWRYTTPEQFDLDSFGRPTNANITVNMFGDASANIPSEVSLTLNDALSENDKNLVEKLLDDTVQDGIEHLRLSLVSEVAVLRIKKRSQIKQPLQICYEPSSKDGTLPLVLVVVVEEGASVSLVEEWGANFFGLSAPLLEVVVEKNAICSFTSVQRMNDEAQLLARHKFHLYRDARGTFIHTGTGAAVSRIDLQCRLCEPGASADLISLFVGDKKRHSDFHTSQEHLAPHCRSDLYSKVALKDSARNVYYGFIKVAEGAQKTDAYQTSRTIVLSENARADSIPNLEIKANDVKCSHGASIGNIREEELFYLRTRGLTAEIAERLLVEGFFADLLVRVENLELREQLYNVSLERLSNGTTGSQA